MKTLTNGVIADPEGRGEGKKERMMEITKELHFNSVTGFTLVFRNAVKRVRSLCSWSFLLMSVTVSFRSRTGSTLGRERPQ